MISVRCIEENLLWCYTGGNSSLPLLHSHTSHPQSGAPEHHHHITGLDLLHLAYLQDHVLLAEEGQLQAAVGGVEAALLGSAHVEHGLVHVELSRHEVTGYFIFVCKDEVIKS